MTRQARTSCRTAALLLAAGFCLIGCSSKEPPKPEPSQENLMKIGIAYRRYHAEHKKSPAKLDDLMPLLREQGEPEQLLRSPDDGQPYVIVWNVDLDAPAQGYRQIVVLAYEKQGKGGKRYVLTKSHYIGRMSDDELSRAGFDPAAPQRASEPPPSS